MLLNWVAHPLGFRLSKSAAFEVVSHLFVVLSAGVGEVLSPPESTYATPY
jgi:hypothetical protein